MFVWECYTVIHLTLNLLILHRMQPNANFYFFSDYNKMRIHFRDEHFLCEEGGCINEQFTSAFRSEIDLKGKNMHDVRLA